MLETLATLDHANGTLRLWDVATGRDTRRLRPWAETDYGEHPIALGFSPDGKTLVTDGAGGGMRLWDVASGRNTRSFPGGGGSTFSPDGQTLATAGGLGVRLWDVVTGTTISTVPAWTSGLEFSPDGQTMATSQSGAGAEGFVINVGGTFHLWDLATGNTRTLTAGHHKTITSALTFSPDGETLATGWFNPVRTGVGTELTDFRVRLWEVSTGTNTGTLVGGDAELLSMAFSPDGKLLATGWDDDRVRLWNLPIDTGP